MTNISKVALRLVLFISIFLIIKINVSAQTSINQKNESEHIIHPKIKLPYSKQDSNPELKAFQKLSFKTVKWLDLLPEKDFDSLSNPPDYLMRTDEGGQGDEILDELRNLPKSIQDDYQRALTSMDVISEMNNTAIRIPGFVVPLEFDNEKKITQFFLVPYFGACIHLPPPPPNQIIFVNFKKGITVNELLDPIWASGILSTSQIENEIALSAYSMEMKHFEIYQ